MDAGGAFSLALKSDGTVLAWGANYHGETNVPPGLSGVTAVAAGEWHGLALKTDGCWPLPGFWAVAKNATANNGLTKAATSSSRRAAPCPPMRTGQCPA